MDEAGNVLVEGRPEWVRTYLDDIDWCHGRLEAIEAMVISNDLAISPHEATLLMEAAARLSECVESMSPDYKDLRRKLEEAPNARRPGSDPA